MVIAARRAYSDAIRWMKEARPSGARSGRLAWKLFRSTYLAALLVLGVIGLARPSRFGSPTSRPLRSIEWGALAVLVVALLVFVFFRRERIRNSLHRFIEPFRHPIDHPSYGPATSALESCPAPLRTRFGFSWVWGPAAGFVLSAFLAASSAYFVIDAILAGFAIGWEQPALAVIQGLLGLLVMRAVARRLATWRLAMSVQRSLSGAYV